MLLATLLAFTLIWAPAPEFHPIHLSVMEIYEDEVFDGIGLSITIFADDFGVAVDYPKHEAEIRAGKLTVDDLIIKYLEEKMEVRINDREVRFGIVAMESNFPALTCYLKPSKKIGKIEKLEVKSEVFLELFDDQKNMVHVKLPGQKGSMILNHKKRQAEAVF